MRYGLTLCFSGYSRWQLNFSVVIVKKSAYLHAKVYARMSPKIPSVVLPAHVRLSSTLPLAQRRHPSLNTYHQPHLLSFLWGTSILETHIWRLMTRTQVLRHPQV